MRDARAERKDGAAEADAAMLKKNAEIESQKKQLTKKRMSFLMKQADVFGKFIGADVMRRCVPRAASPCRTCRRQKPSLLSAQPLSASARRALRLKAEAIGDAAAALEASGQSPGKRHRMTEKEEDELFMKQQAEEEEEVIVRVTKEQTKGFIGFGEMRDYQVEGLNWIVRLYHRGLNGILADEMVRTTRRVAVRARRPNRPEDNDCLRAGPWQDSADHQHAWLPSHV